ncbi:Muscular LMNA-interacting protein, partial [Chelonia mydas]
VPSGESGTKPLTFTFVPSIGRLPTHFQVVDVCKLLVRTSEEPNNESSQEIINRSTIVSDDLALKSGIRQDSESTYHAGTSQKIFQPKEYKMSKGDMQESDLFKAEFVFITDSDEGDEETVSRNSVQQPSVGHGTGHARCQLLPTSHVSSGGESSKPHGDLNVPETQCAALSHSATRSSKQRQLTSPSTFDHLSHKPPAACLISPTKLKVECEIVNPKQASSLEESYNKWQSAARSSKQDSSTCFQATAHSSPLYMPQRSPSVLNSPSSSTQFSKNLQMPNIAMPNYVYNMSEFTASSDPSKSPTPVSYCPNSAVALTVQSKQFCQVLITVEWQQYKIKTSYKAFAAIPTNTLLMEQKALEEPIKTEKVTEDATLDTNSEMCSPAQLRQQTEELCAAIDQVLQDPLPMRRCESSPSSLHTSMDSDVGKANLYLLTPTVTESQLTKPGVIRPGPVKTKILLKTEEPYQPNPFKKYLEETRDPDIEKDNAPLHPLYPTKLIPPTKSPLHPQSICHADCLTPGPFSHLSSILCDVHESSYRPYSRNALYNKVSLPCCYCLVLCLM